MLDGTVFLHLEVPSINTFPSQIKQRLKDQYIQQWLTDLNLLKMPFI